MTKKHHTHSIRVYYEDTDAGGIVYYANYLKFAERARTEALRLAGINQSGLWYDHKIAFAVRRCEVDFLKPARLDDCLTIETALHDISKVSLTMRQIIRRGDDTLATLTVKIAVVGEGMKLGKLPETVKKTIKSILCEA